MINLQRFLRPDRIVLVLFVVLLLIYGLSLQNDFVNYDDEGFIMNNKIVTNSWPETLPQAFSQTFGYLYIPLTIVSWQVTYHIFGMESFWFHLTDLMIHACNCILVFWILSRLTKQNTLAALAALVFAIHPLNVEAVAWASSRKDILSAFFAFLSFATYINASESGERKWLWRSAAFYVVGLFTKIAIFPLPLVLMAYDWYQGKSLVHVTAWKQKWMFFVPMFIFILVAAKSGDPILPSLGVTTAGLLGARSLTLLLELFFWPQLLSPLRYLADEPMLLDPQFLFSVVAFGALLLGILTLFFLRIQKVFVFGSTWILLFLFPTFLAAQKAGLLFVTSEKYFYLPMLGLLFMIFSFAAWFLKKIPSAKLVLLGVYVLAAIGFGVRASAQAQVWRNGTTLFESVLANDPKNSVAKGSLAQDLDTAGKFDESRVLLLEAIAGDPKNATNYLNLAGSYFRAGEMQEGADTIKELLPNLQPRQVAGDNGTREGLIISSNILEQAGFPELSLEILERASNLCDAANVLNAYGLRLVKLSRKEEAYPVFQRAAAAGSEDVNVYYHLAEFYSKNGKKEDLKRVLRKAIQLDPANERAAQILSTME